MRKSIPLLLSTILLLVLCSSNCKKPLVCTGDCYDLRINGNTVNAATGAPVANVPLTLYRSIFSLFATRRKIIDFQSDASGAINAMASIDTSVLRSHYYFMVNLRDNPKWVLGENIDTPLVDVTKSPYDNLQIKVYERKDLTLKLQKVLTGGFHAFSVSCTYAGVHGSMPWLVQSPQDNIETTKTVGMAAGLWAHIDISRMDAAGNSTLTRDSVLMPVGNAQAPVYIVKY